MAGEEKKDFNAMLHDSKDMPKFKIMQALKNMAETECILLRLSTMIQL